MKIWYFLGFLFFLLPIFTEIPSKDAVFHNSIEKYRQGKYEDAVKGFEDLLCSIIPESSFPSPLLKETESSIFSNETDFALFNNS